MQVSVQDNNDDSNENILPLHYACHEGRLDAVKVLLQSGSFDVNEEDDNDWVPLHHAIAKGNLNVVRYLLDSRYYCSNDDHLQCVEGRDAIGEAIAAGHLEVIRYLSSNINDERVVDMNEEYDTGLTPLHVASLSGQYHIVQFLLEDQSVDASVADNDGWTALHYACLGGDLDTVKYLVQDYSDSGGIDVEAIEEDGWTPLHVAANKGCLEIVKYLLEDQKVNRHAVVNEVNQTALHLASGEGRLEVVQYLIEEQQFSLETRTSDDETLLHLASIYGHVDIVKYLLETGCTNDRFEMMFARNNTNETAYESTAALLEMIKTTAIDTESDVMVCNLRQVVKVLLSYVALAAEQPQNPNDACVKLNTDLVDSQQAVAERTLRLLKATPANEVAYHVLGFLCMSDLMA